MPDRLSPVTSAVQSLNSDAPKSTSSPKMSSSTFDILSGRPSSVGSYKLLDVWTCSKLYLIRLPAPSRVMTASFFDVRTTCPRRSTASSNLATLHCRRELCSSFLVSHPRALGLLWILSPIWRLLSGSWVYLSQQSYHMLIVAYWPYILARYHHDATLIPSCVFTFWRWSPVFEHLLHEALVQLIHHLLPNLLGDQGILRAVVNDPNDGSTLCYFGKRSICRLCLHLFFKRGVV